MDKLYECSTLEMETLEQWVLCGQELDKSACKVLTREIVLAFISGSLLCQSVSTEPLNKPLRGEGISVCVCVCTHSALTYITNKTFTHNNKNSQTKGMIVIIPNIYSTCLFTGLFLPQRASTHINHVPPALGPSTEQGLIVGQSSAVDAHIHALVQCLDCWKHGQDLLLIGQVTLVRDQCAAVACTLTFCCQFLKHTDTHPIWQHWKVLKHNKDVATQWPINWLSGLRQRLGKI